MTERCHVCDIQAMFRGGFSGGKTREEFVEEMAEIYISKVRCLLTNKSIYHLLHKLYS